MEELLDKSAEPTGRADLEIWVTPDRGLGLASKAKTARTVAVLGVVLAIVALPVMLLRVQVVSDLPLSIFFFSDALGTIVLFILAVMLLRQPGGGAAA